MTISASRNWLPLSVAFLLTALALAPAAHAQDGACGVIDSDCTLAEISAQALMDSSADGVPDDVVKAGFIDAHLPDGTKATLYKVVVRFEDGTEGTYYYNTADCSRVLPPPIEISFLEAMGYAVTKSLEEAPGMAPPIVLSGKLVNELLAPTYVFKLIDAQGEPMAVTVDAQTGEASVVDPKSEAKKGKKKKKKGKFKCNDADSDSDSESDSESDSDSEDE